MMEEIWKFLHKPRYVDPGQPDDAGESAVRVAARHGRMDMVELLQGLGVDAGVVFAAGEGSGTDRASDSDRDSDGD